MGLNPQWFEMKVDGLWAPDDGQPCPACKALLLKFAEARPDDFEFLTARDMVDPNQLAFAGIPEWDAFLERFSSCDGCDA